MTNYGYLTDDHISWVCSVVQCLAVGGVSSEGAQAVQPREVSLSLSWQPYSQLWWSDV